MLFFHVYRLSGNILIEQQFLIKRTLFWGGKNTVLTIQTHIFFKKKYSPDSNSQWTVKIKTDAAEPELSSFFILQIQADMMSKLQKSGKLNSF